MVVVSKNSAIAAKRKQQLEVLNRLDKIDLEILQLKEIIGAGASDNLLSFSELRQLAAALTLMEQRAFNYSQP